MHDQTSGGYSDECKYPATSDGKRECKKALDDLNDLASFNQYVSYCVGKVTQHLADVMLIQMANFTLLRRLLAGLFKGVKLDMVSNEKCSSSSRIGFKGVRSPTRQQVLTIW